jgi:hypothetical protein
MDIRLLNYQFAVAWEDGLLKRCRRVVILWKQTCVGGVVNGDSPVHYKKVIQLQKIMSSINDIRVLPVSMASPKTNSVKL